MGLELVTGYRNRAHITSGDDGCRNASILGTGKYVMDIGEKFSYQPITLATRIIINDGDLFNQGRHMHLRKGEHIELEIDILESGFERNDLIVARYKKNVTTGIEDAELIILTGDQSSSDPQDPTYYEGNIFSGEMHLEDKEYYIEDFPLYRIKNKGGQLPTVEKLFVVMTNLENIKKEVTRLTEIQSHIGMIVQSTTLDTMEKVISIYGGIAWNKIEGRFLIGASDSYPSGSTGGSNSHFHSTNGHSLTQNEIPSHRHAISGDIVSFTSKNNGNVTMNKGTNFSSLYSMGADSNTSYVGGGAAHNHGNTGSSSHIPSYKAVYIWERTE